MSTIEQITLDALDELNERFMAEPEMPYPEDLVSEIADSSVPIYTYELAQVAQSSIELLLHENELPPAFDGTPTVTNQIVTAIYEKDQESLYERLDVLQKEYENQQSDEMDMTL